MRDIMEYCKRKGRGKVSFKEFIFRNLTEWNCYFPKMLAGALRQIFFKATRTM